MEDNKSIKCSVESCRYCNCENNYCTKSSIEVCNCTSDEEKEATMCDSYKER